ncbi:unnamed protein product [Peronospora destructor]|uniref:Uncharacterized protein n=1 Tax=Peronospora destructor TaxID=86335 RepID=A0AAV0UWS0_9STRA|nr:unnamed protein product [Peronospora destructor]
MGKAVDHSIATKQEFLKLEVVLVQTANDVTKCLKTLKVNLGKYDRRHGLYFRRTSKYFLRRDIRVAKELAADLRYAAKRIYKNKNPTKSELNAARLSTNATTDAMNDLIQSGRIYDQNLNKGVSRGVTSIIDDILGGNDSNQVKHERGSLQNVNGKCTTKQGLFGHKHIGDGIREISDTVEAVVLSTMRESFGGFSALKQQITATEDAMSPWFATRVKEAVVDVANKLAGDSSPSPACTDN